MWVTCNLVNWDHASRHVGWVLWHSNRSNDICWYVTLLAPCDHRDSSIILMPLNMSLDETMQATRDYCHGMFYQFTTSKDK